MAKTKAELQDELIGLRNENKKLKRSLELSNDNWSKHHMKETEKLNEELTRIKVALKKHNKEVFAMTEDKKNLERLKTAHIKLGEEYRNAKDKLQVQKEVTIEMIKEFDNVLMERHEKIKSLKSQNNNLRQTLKDTL